MRGISSRNIEINKFRYIKIQQQISEEIVAYQIDIRLLNKILNDNNNTCNKYYKITIKRRNAGKTQMKESII